VLLGNFPKEIFPAKQTLLKKIVQWKPWCRKIRATALYFPGIMFHLKRIVVQAASHPQNYATDLRYEKNLMPHNIVPILIKRS